MEISTVASIFTAESLKSGAAHSFVFSAIWWSIRTTLSLITLMRKLNASDGIWELCEIFEMELERLIKNPRSRSGKLRVQLLSNSVLRRMNGLVRTRGNVWIAHRYSWIQRIHMSLESGKFECCYLENKRFADIFLTERVGDENKLKDCIEKSKILKRLPYSIKWVIHTPKRIRDQ